MKSLRLCHLGDVHLGYRKYNKLTKTGLNQRETDVNAAFREAIDRIISIKPNATIISGDLFHSVRPSNAVVTFCFRELRRLASQTEAPVIIIAGNHDTPRRVDTGCILRLFAEIPGVHIADQRAERFSFPDLSLSILALPHAALVALGDQTIRADDRFKYNVLAAHAQVDERWMSDFGGAVVDLRALSPHEWDYIALGHVHVRKKIAENAYYSGSLEHTATNIWSEALENKGFLEIELPSGKATFHSLTAPREVRVLEPLDGDKFEPSRLSEVICERLRSVSGGIEGKIIRLEVTNVPREVYRQLNHREFNSLRAAALHLSLEVRAPEIQQHHSPFGASRRGTLEDEINRFASDWKAQGSVSREDIQSLMKGFMEAMEEASEAT